MSKSYYETRADAYKKSVFKHHNISWEMPMHFHKNLEMQYILTDKYEINIENNDYVAEPDDVVFVPSYYLHSGRRNDLLEVYFFMPTSNVTVDFKDLLSGKTPDYILTDKDFNRQYIKPVFELIHKNVSQTNSDLIMKGYFNIIMGNIMAHYGLTHSTKKYQSEQLPKILNYLDEHACENITLESVASHFGYNKYYFSKLFKQITQTSFNQYLNIVRIQKFVKKLNMNKQANIANLAFVCGFNSLSTFYRAFEEVYKVKPSEYFSLNEEIYW